MQELFKNELSPVPASLFDDYGLMSKGNKSVVVNKLAVFASNELENVTLELVDGNEALYHRPWPKLVTVRDFANSFCKFFAKSHEVFVIFEKIHFRGHKITCKRKARCWYSGNTVSSAGRHTTFFFFFLFFLCEKTDNEVSGSTEALAVTLIKYNFKKHKNNGKYSNTKNRVKNTIIHSQTYSDPTA